MSMASMGIEYTDDPVRDAERYYSALEEMPYVCERCGCELHGEAYEYLGDYYCADCILEKTYVDLEDM